MRRVVESGRRVSSRRTRRGRARGHGGQLGRSFYVVDDLGPAGSGRRSPPEAGQWRQLAIVRRRTGLRRRPMAVLGGARPVFWVKAGPAQHSNLRRLPRLPGSSRQARRLSRRWNRPRRQLPALTSMQVPTNRAGPTERHLSRRGIGARPRVAHARFAHRLRKRMRRRMSRPLVVRSRRLVGVGGDDRIPGESDSAPMPDRAIPVPGERKPAAGVVPRRGPVRSWRGHSPPGPRS